MANEAILRNRRTDPHQFTVADGTGIEKGSVLKVTDPRTAAASDGLNDAVAGIAAREKVASDGRTQLAVFTPGSGNIFDMTASGSVTIGDPVISVGVNNLVEAGDASDKGLEILGYSLETASNAEVFQVLV